MKKIASFTVDHLRLLRGVYVSRKDHAGDTVVTTFDVRMKEPNREPVLHQGAAHTIEHLGATFLRNDAEWKDRIIYWGPMGCFTGFYLIVAGDYKPEDILPLLIRVFSDIAIYEGPIPGATPAECGNYLLQDLPMAHYEALRYLEVLNNAQAQNLNYPE